MAADNNRADTVLQLFIDGVQVEYDLIEDVEMRRGSFITQRIERLWYDVFQSCLIFNYFIGWKIYIF